MIRDRWRREASMGAGYAALYCAVRGAGYASAREPSLLAAYYALIAGLLVVAARRLAR